MSFEDLVLSDVHVETCPPGERLWTTTFTVEEDCNLSSCLAPFNAPRAEVDEDGDLVVPRRTPSNRLGKLYGIAYTHLSEICPSMFRGTVLGRPLCTQCTPSTLIRLEDVWKCGQIARGEAFTFFKCRWKLTLLKQGT